MDSNSGIGSGSASSSSCCGACVGNGIDAVHRDGVVAAVLSVAILRRKTMCRGQEGTYIP